MYLLYYKTVHKCSLLNAPFRIIYLVSLAHCPRGVGQSHITIHQFLAYVGQSHTLISSLQFCVTQFDRCPFLSQTNLHNYYKLLFVFHIYKIWNVLVV